MAIPVTVIPSFAEDTVQYSEKDLHELVSYTDAVSSGHVNRLNDEETMNTLVFANADNTKTTYYYADDIKYTDARGEIHDKTNDLTYKNGAYVSRDNDVVASLPNDISSGVTVSYEGIRITMTPAFMQSGLIREPVSAAVYAATPKGEADAVTYNSVFGRDTSVRYTPQYSGLKEEIILSSYTGIYKFDFTVETGGLLLVCKMPEGEEIHLDDMGEWYFTRPDDIDTPVARLSDIVIYDSAGNMAQGALSCSRISDGVYTVTVTADRAFLESSDTVYPVTIDPTITVTENSASSYIMDATISGLYPSTNYGTSTTLSINKSTESCIVMAFPAAANDMGKVSNIVDAKLYMRSYSSGGSSSTAEIYAYQPKAYTPGANETQYEYPNMYWHEKNITYSKNGASVSGTPVTVGTYNTEYTITSIVKSWTGSGCISWLKGLLIKVPSSASSSYCDFRSSEYSDVNYRPHLKVTYKNSDFYRIKNVSSGKYLTVSNGYDDDKINVIQQSLATDQYESSQIFRIKYDASVNAERIYPLSSWNGKGRVLDVQYTDTADKKPAAGCNVQIYKPTNNVSQCFIVKKIDGDNQYNILLSYNESLMLASVGTGNGTSSGTGGSSTGNVCLDSATGSRNKVWILEPVSLPYQNTFANLGFLYPLKDADKMYQINSDYGNRPSSGIVTHHDGIDIYAVKGTKVYSPVSGTIVAANTDSKYNRGNYIVVKLNKKVQFNSQSGYLYIIFMHLNKFEKTGGNINAGDLIAYSGDTGGVAAHLHMEVLFLTSDDTSGNYYSHYYDTIDPIVFYPDTKFTFK